MAQYLFAPLNTSPRSRVSVSIVTTSAALVLFAYLWIRPALNRNPAASGPRASAPSPRSTVLPGLSSSERDALPYPPDLLPGGRDVETPFGSLRVYEWGPSNGDKVLLLHGIGTPCLALGEMAKSLVAKGCRVMLFDFFGRGYSDAPLELPYDARLYMAQVLLALSSSQLPWSGNDAFHLVGYSLGGAIAASFARYHPHAVKSLALVASGGLIRPHHVSWKSRLLYSEGFLPEQFLHHLIRQRLWPETGSADMPEMKITDYSDREQLGEKIESDARGGSSFDDAVLAAGRPDLRVARVMEWQLRHHHGFVAAYKSTILHAPIYDQGEREWAPLRRILDARRRDFLGVLPGLKGGKVFLVMGETDPVVVPAEMQEDAKKALGDEAVLVQVIERAGHEVGITRGGDVAEAIVAMWTTTASPDQLT